MKSSFEIAPAFDIRHRALRIYGVSRLNTTWDTYQIAISFMIRHN